MYEIEDKMTAAGFDTERVEFLTRGAYKAKAEQYPSEVGGYAEFIRSHWVGGRTADCIGLIKGYGWFDPESGKIGNPYGVAGLMGNLYAESGLLPNNLQDSYEVALGCSDSSYTQAVDSGSYANFSNDSAGYGLAQWTASGRKRDLLAFANERSCSISDLDMQLDFLCKELESKFPGVLSVLKNAQSVREASDYVLFRFEAPLDQSESVQIRRAANDSVYYGRYG